MYTYSRVSFPPKAIMKSVHLTVNGIFQLRKNPERQGLVLPKETWWKLPQAEHI